MDYMQGTGQGIVTESGDSVPQGPIGRYLSTTRGLGYSVLFALPLAILYELGILITTHGDVRIGADVWIRRFLSMLGLDNTLFLTAIFLVVAVVVVAIEKKRGIRFTLPYFGGMFGESVVYALASGVLVSTVVESIIPMQWPPRIQMAGGLTLSDQIVLSLGAGFYEELVFRLILVSAIAGFFALIVRALKLSEERFSKTLRYSVAAVLGALVFSWVHYTGAFGDTFHLGSFTFRFLMGLVLNVIFLWRGFGVAAMTHALYDIVVTLMH